MWRQLKTKWREENAAMKCFDCGSVRHLAFRKEFPTQVYRMEKKMGILDWVQKQLMKTFNPSEIFACPAVASDDSLNIEHEENSTRPSDFVEVRFSLDQNNVQESESEDDLFGTAFERSLSHIMENSLSTKGRFRSGSAN